uniref:Uncharacterized protein n=1 Tax=Romanomermis culicivorax TaxID=13658 RepID=A0A915L491_ROMCU
MKYKAQFRSKIADYHRFSGFNRRQLATVGDSKECIGNQWNCQMSPVRLKSSTVGDKNRWNFFIPKLVKLGTVADEIPRELATVGDNRRCRRQKS